MNASPLLDNIETSFPTPKGSKSLTDKEYSDCIDEKLYTQLVLDFEKYKKLSVEVADSLRFFASNEKLKEKGLVMLTCGACIEFLDGRLVNADFCRIRLCPMCQRRKALKTYSDFVKMQSELTDYAFLHLTLTVPNCDGDELSDTIKTMNKLSSKLFSLEPFKKAFKGVARHLEVSYNSTTIKFHPHFHCLVAVKPSYFKSRVYIKAETIQRLWSVLWKMRNENLKSDKWDTNKLLGVALADDERLQVHIVRADSGALAEIAKYAVKPLEFECTLKERAKVLEVLYEALNGKRLLYLSGVFKEVSARLKLKLDDDEELPPIDKTQTINYYWNYRHAQYEREE